MIVEIKESTLLEEKMVIPLILKQRSVFTWRVKLKVKRLLVILSLAHPFNLYADTACFRLPGRVFFLSQLKEIYNSLSILKCTKDKPFIEYLIDKKISQLKTPELSDLQEKNPLEAQEVLLPFVYMEKLKLTAVGRGKGKLSALEMAKLGKACRDLHWENLDNEEKSLLISEVFLRERFSSEGDISKAVLEYRRGLNVKDKHEFFSLRPSDKIRTVPNNEN